MNKQSFLMTLIVVCIFGGGVSSLFWIFGAEKSSEVAGTDVFETLSEDHEKKVYMNEKLTLEKTIQSESVISLEQVSEQLVAKQLHKVTDRFPPQLAAEQVYFQVTKDGYAVTAGDMLMGKVLPEQKNIKDGAYLPQETRLWPSSTIPFMIAKEVGNPQPIIEAISYFNQSTPVRFVEVEEGDDDGIIFLPHDDLCASHLGRVGGFQPIFISGHCGKSEVIHELMHALGFVHEHSRQDRDQFVKIHWQNIKEEFLFQFNKMPDQLVHNYSGSVFDFDAESIMLYPEEAFAKAPGLKTLDAIGGSRIRPARNELSRMDRERVYYLYGH